MKEKLTKEEVLHVADLARIKLTEEEIEKFQVQLKQLLEDVEKINEVKGYEMLDPKEVLENAPRKSGNYIAVPVVIGGGEGA